MEDTDWRPSPCPVCGGMREAARNPVCRNPDCSEDVAKRNLGTMKTQKRYLWIRPNSAESPMLLIDDPVELYRGGRFDESTDKLYELGPEVKLEVNIKVIPTKPVYRGYGMKMITTNRNRGDRTPFENRD